MQKNNKELRRSKKLTWQDRVKTYKQQTPGDVIRDYCESQDMTQKEFADDLHYTPQAVSNWSNNKIVSMDALLQLHELGFETLKYLDLAVKYRKENPRKD